MDITVSHLDNIVTSASWSCFWTSCGIWRPIPTSAKNGGGGLCPYFYQAKRGEADFARDCSNFYFSLPFSLAST